MAGDFGEHLLWRQSGKPSHGGGDDDAEGEDAVVNGDQVAYGSGVDVDWLRDVFQQLIGLGWKETKVAVGDPVGNHRLSRTLNACRPFAGPLPAYPGEFEPSQD